MDEIDSQCNRSTGCFTIDNGHQQLRLSASRYYV